MKDADAEMWEIGRKLFAGPAEFVGEARTLDLLPRARSPEIGFAGRSNVGKSSLLNALVNRKKLARASSEPGRTRALNFFDLGGRLTLVDLPGYGYARAPKTEIARWTRVTRDFLRGRAELCKVLLLIDARHGPKDVDIGIMEVLDQAAVAYGLVLTKCDKIHASELSQRVDQCAQLARRHPAAFPSAFATSAETGHGIEALRADLAAHALALS